MNTITNMDDAIESLASEVLNEQGPACNFSDDSELFEMDVDFNEIWEGR